MRWLVDANILARAYPPPSSQHPAVHEAVARLLRHGEELCFCPGIAREFWNLSTRVATPPAPPCPQCGKGENGGFGLLPGDALSNLELIEENFRFFPEDITVFSDWKSIVHNQQIVGRHVHDSAWIALMHVNQISRFLSLDARLKTRAKTLGIDVITPEEVLNSPDYPPNP